MSAESSIALGPSPTLIIPARSGDTSSADAEAFWSAARQGADRPAQNAEAAPLVAFGKGLNAVDRWRIDSKVGSELHRANWDGATEASAAAAVSRIQGWALETFGNDAPDALDHAKAKLQAIRDNEGQSPQLRHVAGLMLDAW